MPFWSGHRSSRRSIAGGDLDTFAPLGPALVLKDEIPNPNELRLRTILNGQVMQEDKELSERVQAGLNSYGFEFGPMSSYETLIHDYHERVRQACPVASLPQAPAAGTTPRQSRAASRVRIKGDVAMPAG